MRPLEDELRKALRPSVAPPGFTARVMARVEQRIEQKAEALTRARPRPRREWAPRFWPGRHARLSFAALAAVLMLTVSLSLWQRRRTDEQQREGRAARAQVIEALRITNVELNRVRFKVRAATEDGSRGRAPGSATGRGPQANLDLL